MLELSMDALLQKAGDLVDFHDLQPVRAKLKEEFIIGIWQLSYLDSMQWASLGVPIGFGAALQHLIQDERGRIASRAPLQSMPQRDRKSMFLQASIEDSAPAVRKSMFAVPVSAPPPMASFAHSPRFDVEDSSVSTCSQTHSSVNLCEGIQSCTLPDAHTESIRFARIRALLTVLTWKSIVDIIIPFFHRRAVKRAILHGKSCAEIRDFMYRKAELYFFGAALCSGVFADLWGQFPDNSESPFQFTFHLLSTSTIFLSTAVTALNIGLIIVSCGVELQHFKKFQSIAMDFEQVIDYAFFATIYLAFSTLMVLTFVKCCDVTLQLENKVLVWIYYGAVVGPMLLLLLFFLCLYNEMGRLTFHGGLLVKRFDSDADAATRSDMTLIEKERFLTKSVSKSLKKADIIVDECAKAFDETSIGDGTRSYVPPRQLRRPGYNRGVNEAPVEINFSQRDTPELIKSKIRHSPQESNTLVAESPLKHIHQLDIKAQCEMKQVSAFACRELGQNVDSDSVDM